LFAHQAKLEALLGALPLEELLPEEPSLEGLLLGLALGEGAGVDDEPELMIQHCLKTFGAGFVLKGPLSQRTLFEKVPLTAPESVGLKP
jgi:hypothetical protein